MSVFVFNIQSNQLCNENDKLPNYHLIQGVVVGGGSCGHLYLAVVTCIKRSPFSCPVIKNFKVNNNNIVVRYRIIYSVV
jgi:hypothetical protein